MAQKPCANLIGGALCGAHKAHAVHSRFHPQFHEYLDARTAGLQPMSAGMRAFRKNSGYDAAVEEAKGKPCQIMSPVCTGLAEHKHEVLPRGRAGGLKASLALAPAVDACDACNGYVTGEGLTWGREHGFVVSRKDLGLDRIGEEKRD